MLYYRLDGDAVIEAIRYYLGKQGLYVDNQAEDSPSAMMEDGSSDSITIHRFVPVTRQSNLPS